MYVGSRVLNAERRIKARWTAVCTLEDCRVLTADCEFKELEEDVATQQAASQKKITKNDKKITKKNKKTKTKE